MNNILKFSIGIFSTLAFAWLAFVIGARKQFGDLEPSPTSLEEDGSIPDDAELFPRKLSGIALQGSKEYVSLGCTTCHTQQVRLVEAGFDVERGWGKRPSVPRDYIFHEEVNIGNTRVGPDLANVGQRGYSDEWLHIHLFQPQIVVPDSICPPSPFLYQTVSTKTSNAIEVKKFSDEPSSTKFIVPTLRANRVISYLNSLKQDYELPEMSFIDEKDDQINKESEPADEISEIEAKSTSELPVWLANQISSGKEVYMKVGPGGGMCFTCHQPTGLGLPGQFPPLAGSDWVLGNKERLIKITMHGLMGEIEVNGVKYNNVMAPPGIPPGSLTDQQIADVLTYIRNDWGNSASSISPEEVANIRESVKDRPAMQMWTSAELNSN
jgi:cytochrome c oxidase cbb3-type subunit 2